MKKNLLAKYVSIFTSPYLIGPVFGLLIIWFYTTTLKQFFVFGGLFFLCIVLVPAVYILYQVFVGKISDAHVAQRAERNTPFLVTLISSFVLIVIYKILEVPNVLFLMIILFTVNSLLLYLITKFWKISIHSAVFFGSILMLSLFINKYFLFLIFVMPLIIWARNKSGSHTIAQGVVAALVVGVVSLATFYLF